jgi:hypothetical protein
MAYENSVFVNCPFDEDYKPLLKSLLFGTLYMGFEPRVALERLDSSETRVEKIIELIQSSRFGIHDLSRLKSKKKGEYFRLNMPFELGLDIGCKVFGKEKFSSKKCLILEKEHYRFQAALSDLSGSDIRVHQDSPMIVVVEVRNWLAEIGHISRPPSGSAVWNAYNDFCAWQFDQLTPQGYSKEDIATLPIGEVLDHMRQWVKLMAHPVRPALARA